MISTSSALCAGNPPTRPEGLWILQYWAAWLDPLHPNPARPGELRWYIRGAADEDIEVDINPADVRIDTFRSSGAGGQKVNKTDSAIRMTHLPTGIVVSMQNERSQHKNRDMAWKVLKSRLYELELRKQQAERDKIEAGKSDISFGSQIRNYVLAPYRMVKDVRTGVESGNTDAVLDGELDSFISAYLLGVRRKDRPGATEEE